MNVIVILPSRQYLTQAGARIRYQRIADPLGKRGVKLQLVSIDELPILINTSSDIFLFSKCQDARAVGLAHDLRKAGGIVGVDLFDDYFSQSGDSRFASQRNWLRRMAAHASFFLCSTPRMQEVGREYFGSIPGHVLNDPYKELRPKQLVGELERKRKLALQSGILRVLWFGIGDNPSFAVGLQDLVRFGERLLELADADFKIELTILTNLRALDVERLEQLRRLPVPFFVDEWTEHREVEALAQNLISFIPVNSQPFSMAKSLNRAVSAITGGTQVFSVGYPLYEPLDQFIYRDGRELLQHLRSGNLRVRGGHMEELTERLRSLSDPRREADELIGFLNGVTLPSGNCQRMHRQVAILHGAKSTVAIHKFAQQRGWLSLGTPLTPAGVDYDSHLGFFGNGLVPALRLTARCAELLPAELRRMIVQAPKDMGKGPDLMLPLTALKEDLSVLALGPKLTANGAARASVAQAVVENARQLFERLLGPMFCVPSELDSAVNVADAKAMIAAAALT